MTFNYNNTLYEIDIIRKKNKNLYIRVVDDKIIVTCNQFIVKKKIEKIINDNRETIIKMIIKSNQKRELKEKFIIFGKEYDVVYGFNSLEIDDNKIYTLDEKRLNKWLKEYIYNTFSSHLTYWYSLFQEDIPTPNLKIRKMTSRWGVCNLKNRNVTLNVDLIKYDVCCLDYVIVHELSHFIHPNHSKDFWMLVSKYCKNYKEIRKKLK